VRTPRPGRDHGRALRVASRGGPERLNVACGLRPRPRAGIVGEGATRGGPARSTFRRVWERGGRGGKGAVPARPKWRGNCGGDEDVMWARTGAMRGPDRMIWPTRSVLLEISTAAAASPKGPHPAHRPLVWGQAFETVVRSHTHLCKDIGGVLDRWLAFLAASSSATCAAHRP
jgi:hypothetical protein